MTANSLQMQKAPIVPVFTREQFNAFLATLPFPPNPFQLAILESIAFGSGNKLVSALAGSGKTSLLVQTAHLLKAMGETSAMYLAFNVKIKQELNERLPEGYAAINSHSLGFMLCKQINPQADPDKGWKKWSDLCRDAVRGLFPSKNEEYSASRKLMDLCSKVMLNYIDIHDTDAIAGLDVHHNMEADTRLFGKVAGVINEAETVFRNTGIMNFDEQLYWPVVMGIQPPQHKWVFIDECQDLNILQQKLALASVAEGGRMVWVGDVRQAVYGFAGADARAFARIKDLTNADELPLNICYRCPTSHLDQARKLVPQIESRSGAPEGTIIYADPDKLHETAQIGMLIMCRLKAPLMGAYFHLIKNKIPAVVLGRDIGRELTNTLDKVSQMDGFRYERIVEYLERYQSQQVYMLSQKENSEQQIQNLNDRIECLITCAVSFIECHDMDCLKRELEKLFGDEKDIKREKVVTLCTVHKAKGLEAKRTGILQPDKMPLVWTGQQQWEAEQERNIKYVALTRSTDTMVVYGKEGCLGIVIQPATTPTLSAGAAFDDDGNRLLQIEVRSPQGETVLAPLPNADLTGNKPVIDDASKTALDALKSMSLFDDDEAPAAPAPVQSLQKRYEAMVKREQEEREQTHKSDKAEAPAAVEGPKPFRATGDLAADLAAQAGKPLQPPAPPVIQKPKPEDDPNFKVIPAQPQNTKQRLEEIAESMTDDDIDRLIEFLQAVKTSRETARTDKAAHEALEELTNA